MQILVFIVVAILKSLIWIGDQTFKLIAFLKSIRIFSPPSFPARGWSAFGGKFKTPKVRGVKKNFLKVFTETSLLRFKIYLLFESLTNKFRALQPKKRYRIKRVKPQVIFSRRGLNLLKFKYFTTGVFFSLIFFFVPLLFFIFIQSLPDPRQLGLRDIAQTTKIYDRSGTLLYQIYSNQNRTLVSLKSIPQDLKNATIAIEDKDFYKNPGFNIQAIIRAAISNLRGEPLQGGSTITQQLIKSTLLTPEKSLSRKTKEIILAFWAEKIYTKDQILEMYLNQVPYGGTAWGVEAASQTYFGKKVKDLTFAESTFLAGMPKAPTIYSPYGDSSNLWKKRQKEVLTAMEKAKYITKEKRQEAENENLVFLPPQSPINAPHFVFYIKDLLIKKYGLAMTEKGGLNVITSLDLKLQEKAQQQVRSEVEKTASYNLTNGASLVTNPKNGDILAMVGSKNFDEPEFGNVNVTTSLRQPGSTIKVVTYSAALHNGFTAATPIADTPISFRSASGIYSPVNYDGRFHGTLSLRLALGNSINVPAVKTLNKIGIPTMVGLAQRMGITTWEDPGRYGLAITLGAAEVKMIDMATLYATLANQGKRIDIDPLLRVSDSKGDILYQKRDPKGVQVIDPGIAFIISNILADNAARSLEFGPNSPLNIPGVSVKTGTSDKIRDNWTIGFTPSYLVAVWVGNNNGAPMSGIASGITGAAPIWRGIMADLLLGTKRDMILPPQNIVEKFCFGRKEFFIRGTENSVRCALPSPTSTPTPPTT